MMSGFERNGKKTRRALSLTAVISPHKSAYHHWSVRTVEPGRTASAKPTQATLREELRRGESIVRESSYMLGAGVPSDHLSTITKNTAMGGKLWSCGYDCSDKYQ